MGSGEQNAACNHEENPGERDTNELRLELVLESVVSAATSTENTSEVNTRHNLDQ